jgi:hypothetical protein
MEGTPSFITEFSLRRKEEGRNDDGLRPDQFTVDVGSCSSTSPKKKKSRAGWGARCSARARHGSQTPRARARTRQSGQDTPNGRRIAVSNTLLTAYGILCCVRIPPSHRSERTELTGLVEL